MTYQEQTRGFHVTSYYVVQKTWTLQQKMTNKQKKKKTNSYMTAEKNRDVFRFSYSASLWGYPYLAGVNLHKLPKTHYHFS